MLFIDHFFKWCFAALFALVYTVLVGGFFVAISALFIDPPSYESVQRSVEASNLRQIAQSCLIYAADNQDRLPDAHDLPDYARLLALEAGLNDPSLWVGSVDSAALPDDFKTVLVAAPNGTRTLDPRFAQLPYLYTVVLDGITLQDPQTTPIAWTRGLDFETGRWRADSPYGDEGGHIAFLGGKVAFYRTLQNNSGGELVALDGRPTHRLRDALPPQARISPGPGPAPTAPTLGERLRKFLRDVPAAMRVIITWAWPLWMLALFFKATLAIARTWGVPIAQVRIESRPRWLILAPAALMLLSIVFQV